MPEPSLSPAFKGLTAREEMRERAYPLAWVLKVPPSTFAGKEAAAYYLMSHLLAIPTLRDRGRRGRYLNELLPNVGRLFPAGTRFASEFVGVLRQIGYEMRKFPPWYTHVTNSNEKLVDEYRIVTTLLKGMAVVCIAPLALGAPVAQGAIEGAHGKAESGGRAVATAFVKGGAKGGLESVTGGLGRSLGAVWVIGTFAAQGMEDRRKLITFEIIRRFNDGRMPVDLYRRAMGEESNLRYVYCHRVR